MMPSLQPPLSRGVLVHPPERRPRDPSQMAQQRALSRRRFLQHSGLTAAAAVLTPAFIGRMGWTQAAVLPPDFVADTLNGLVAFIVPGTDAYSVHQGVSTAEPGGIEANTTAPLIFGLDQAGVAPPPFERLSELVAFLLNNVAQAVNPSPIGPFSSTFANLIFAEKVAVFAAMEGGLAGSDVVPLAGALPLFTAFTAYSEAGVFDPVTRTLVATPLGWTLTQYEGVADGRAEFKGYFQNRRKVRDHDRYCDDDRWPRGHGRDRHDFDNED